MVQNRDSLFTDTFSRMIYVCPDDSSVSRHSFISQLEQSCPFLEVVKGTLPNIDSVLGGQGHCCLIVDDLSTALLNDKAYMEIVISYSHHENITLIYTCQNCYQRSKYGVTIQRNLSVFVCFQNSSDQFSISCLSRTIFNKTSTLPSAFQWLTDHIKYKPNQLKYIVVLCQPIEQDSPYRIMTCIFPSDNQNPFARKNVSSPIFLLPR